MTDCTHCEGTGKVLGNPVWVRDNQWKDTWEWCEHCEGTGQEERPGAAQDFSAVHSECLSTENGQADKMDKPCGCSQGGCAIEDGDELYPGYCCRRTSDRETPLSTHRKVLSK